MTSNQTATDLLADPQGRAPANVPSDPPSQIPDSPSRHPLDHFLPRLDSQPSPLDDADLPTLRDRIILHLARATDYAAARLLAAAAGQSPFRSDTDLKAALALLRTFPRIIEHIETYDDRLVPLDGHEFNRAVIDEARHIFDTYNPNVGLNAVPVIPRCPICLKGPAAHWVDDCPERQPHHDLRKLKELQGKGKV